MKISNKITKKILNFLFLFSILLSTAAHSQQSQNQSQPYYGFFPSERGRDYKTLRHNILGFSIDIPSFWTFGINGKPPLAVAIIYPEGMNTRSFSESYETLEIGQIPIPGISLIQAQRMVMDGIKLRHPTQEILEPARDTHVNEFPALVWTYKWHSKTGFDVIEKITLIKFHQSVRSVTIRTTREDFSRRQTFYSDIVSSFIPFAPEY